MKNINSILPLICGLILITATAVVLRHIDENRSLGDPGLLMVAAEVYDEDGGIVNTNTVALPEQVLGFDSRTAPITRTELDWLPSDTTYARRIYSSTNGSAFQVNVVMMGLDRSSIHKPQICLTGQGWNIESESEDRVELQNTQVEYLPVRKMVATRDHLDPDGSRQKVSAIYTYWFVADGRITSRHGERMLWSAEELLRSGTLQRWAYVSVLGLCLPGGEDETYETMKKFISAAAPSFHRFSETEIVRVSD